jgi:hypothetical protein
VDFRVADATRLEGLENRFDAVVDCAFYHVFEFGDHNVNGFKMPRALSEDDFRQVLPVAGWEITYLGPNTYQGNVSVETFEMMAARNPMWQMRIRCLNGCGSSNRGWSRAACTCRSGRYTPAASTESPVDGHTF